MNVLQQIEDARIKKGIPKKFILDSIPMNGNSYKKIIENGCGNFNTIRKICGIVGLKNITL